MDPYRTRKAARWIALIIVIAMVITSFSFIVFLPSMLGAEGSVVYGAEKEDKYLDEQAVTLENLIKYIQKNYKDVVTAEELMTGAFDGVVNSLGDPYSVYYKTEAESADFEDNVSGLFYGVGVVIQMEDGKCTVSSTVAASPAQKAGVKAGDIITSVDGTSAEGKNLNEMGILLRGNKGTSVTITVQRGSQSLTFNMIREMIKSASVTYKMLEDNIAYFQITSFDIDTDQEFAMARMAMINKGAKAFIIDVRDNPGGYINTAAGVAEQLMPAGPITHLTQQGKDVETISAKGSAEYFLPTVLLVNGGSASASEILAGALKDSGSAAVVGTNTFGKGIAQQVVQISDKTAMKLSMYYFLTPNRTVIDHAGIAPQYTVESGLRAEAEELIKVYSGFAPMSEKTKPQKGDTGLNVYGAQQRLAMIGYDVEVTGTMDDRTVLAVSKFQSEHALAPYGSLDYTTMSKIDTAVASYITGVDGSTDLQLQKAVELINQGKVKAVK